MSPARSRKRRSDIDLLRVVGAFGIVWFHMSLAGSEVAYSGLVVFVVISAFFAATEERKPISRDVRFKILAMLRTWLVWYLVYALFNLLRDRPPVPHQGSLVATVLSGPSIHLWYLPFFCLLLLFTRLVIRRGNERRVAVGSSIALAFGFVFVEAWREPSLNLGSPWAQYVHALPGILFGWMLSGRTRFSATQFWLMVGCILLSVALALPHTGVGLPYLLGFLSTTVLVHSKGFLAQLDVHALSDATLGVYLIHPLVMSVVRWCGLIDSLLSAVTVFVFSAGLVFLAKKVAPRAARLIF